MMKPRRDAPMPKRWITAFDPRMLLVLALLPVAATSACRRRAHDDWSPPTFRDRQASREIDDQRTREIVALASADPLAFLRECRRTCIETVRDYRCLFHMRERKGDRWPDEQVIAVRFREKPYSVEMRWIRNPEGAKRISYVADRWVRRGRQLALIVPSGIAGIAAPAGVRLDIRGPEVRAASSRSIDQFGFLRTLDRIIELCEQGAGQPGYELRYVGEGTVDDRPCFVLERKLPYAGPDGPFPDRLAVIHIDRERLVPLAVRTFADDDRAVPLGSFITTNVEFNVGLTDADFE